jgi:aminobenzoyl-glutamate transport protein
MTQSASTRSAGDGILGFIERLGNRLPDPIFLFIGATVIVMLLSGLGSALKWSVQPQRPTLAMQVLIDDEGREVRVPMKGAGGRPVIKLLPAGQPIEPRNLLSAEGIYWLVANMIRNFLNFPPLGIVLVGMFGIGLAEKVGLFGSAMKYLAGLVPSRLLTPTVVLLGILSNVATDAGYIILPPLAAGLYLAFGRSPVAGIAAAFAGVAGGFSANVMIAATDTLVSGITEVGARTIDPSYQVLPTCNWWFMGASTVLLTLLAWAVTAWIVEPRLTARREGMSDADLKVDDHALSIAERRGLRWALLGLLLALAVVGALLTVPGSPLHGQMPAPAPRHGEIPASLAPAPGAFLPSGEPAGGRGPIPGETIVKPGFTIEAEGEVSESQRVRGTFRLTEEARLTGRLEPGAPPGPRWSQAVVPIIFFVFMTPGLFYGVATGAIRSTRDVSKCFIHAMSSMAPVIAMAFFAAQFLECLRFSRLDTMLANLGGQALVSADLPPALLLAALVTLTMCVNLLMASMSAKWTALAPIVVPMLMMAGISPELTQCAYRLGDSVTNIITPLNSYMIVVLVVLQKYVRDAGIGSLVSTMLPYSGVFFAVWTIFLIVWVTVGLPIGPGAPLWYVPPTGHE